MSRLNSSSLLRTTNIVPSRPECDGHIDCIPSGEAQGKIVIFEKDLIGRGRSGRSSAVLHMHYSFPPAVELALITWTTDSQETT